MLLFVSDLHLADSRRRSLFDLTAFAQVLTDALHQAERNRVESLTLVFLGDVFELLKSSIWLTAGVRPWEPQSAKIASVVDKIMGLVVDANQDFFHFLQDASKRYPFLSLVYVPGNHDNVLNTLSGSASRVRLRKLLPLGDYDDRPFRENFQDVRHRVFAQHGHQWDSHNVYRVDTAPIGDLIVIDVVARFPHAVARVLGISPDDPRIDFLHEVDTVLPQTPHAMAQWILSGFEKLVSEGFSAQAIEEALEEITTSVSTAISNTRFEGTPEAKLWINLIQAIVTLVLTRYGGTRAALLFGEETDTRQRYASSAKHDLARAQSEGLDYRYVIYGHTHVPDFRVLAGGSAPRIYLNIGTWRRIHRMAMRDSGDQPAEFMRCTENTYAVIYNAAEVARGCPEYVFRPVVFTS